MRSPEQRATRLDPLARLVPLTPTLLVGAAVPSLLLLLLHDVLPWYATPALVLAAAACCWALTKQPDLELRPVLLTIGAVALVAIALAPVGSRDVWSYVMYGRMLGVHGTSPYLHTPSQFRSDPFFSLVGWRGTPSMYGPLFNVFSAAGAMVSGRSIVIARLWHQLAAGGALAAMLALIWRRTRDPGAVAWLGLHPLILVSVINGGHNDLLVGLLLAAAVLALSDGHEARAGGLAAASVLIKATAALGCIGLLAWAFWQRDRRGGLRVAAGMGFVAALGAIPFGLEPIRVLDDHANLISPSSIWQLGGKALAAISHSPVKDARFLGVIGVLALAGLVARWHRNDAQPAVCVAGTVAAYEAAGPYILPWYAAWSLPALALDRRAALARWAWWYAAFILVAYELPAQGVVISQNFRDLVVVAAFPFGALTTFVISARWHRVAEPKRVALVARIGR